MPAYFVVRTAIDPIVLHMLSSLDWVIEYVDDKGVLHIGNNYGEQNLVRAEFMGKRKLVYVKIYPYKYADNSEMFLYAENVPSVTVSFPIPAAFAASEPRTPTLTP